jgi:hypothetical protein
MSSDMSSEKSAHVVKTAGGQPRNVLIWNMNSPRGGAGTPAFVVKSRHFSPNQLKLKGVF